MSALASSEELDSRRAGLSAYLCRLIEQAADYALELAAETVAVEHLLGVALRDEDSAAHQTVVHAFADPPTLVGELLALSPGLMVVGSSASLPFSPRAIVTLELARRGAQASEGGTVDVPMLFGCALLTVPDTVREDLVRAGLRADFAASAGVVGAPDALAAALPPTTLFRVFDATSKQVLGRACHAARRAGEPSIGPARLLLACLAIDPELAAACGLGTVRAAEVLRGRTLDDSRPPSRSIRPDPQLLRFLALLPEGAGSLDLLLAGHAHGSVELRELLTRHKLGPELLTRAARSLTDPD